MQRCASHLNEITSKESGRQLKFTGNYVPSCLSQLIWKIGLLINFNVAVLKEGIRRKVLDFVE